MELYKGHLQDSFRKKLEESGVKFSDGQVKNRKLSKEEIEDRKKQAEEKEEKK